MGVHGCARVPPVATIRHRASQVLPTSHHRGWSCHWTISDLLFSALFNVHLRRSRRHYHPQQESLGLAGCHRGDVGGTGKKATGCLLRARFLSSAAHVDGNADDDCDTDEDDLLNSEAVNTQRSDTIGPCTHP